VTRAHANAITSKRREDAEHDQATDRRVEDEHRQPVATVQALHLQALIGNRAVRRLPAPPDRAQSVIRRVMVESSKGAVTRAADSSATAIDTRKMSKQERTALSNSMAAQIKSGDKDAAALLDEIRKEWTAQRTATPEEVGDFSFLDNIPVFEKELVALESAFGKLQNKQKLSAENVGKLKDLTARVRLAVDAAVSDPDLADAGLRKLRPLLKRIGVIAADPAVENYGFDENLSMDVSAQDIADYRADTLEMGTFGGLGEAQAVAAALHISFDIWVVVGGKFRLSAPNVGAGPKSNRILLHLGDHYVVLDAAAVAEDRVMPDRLQVVAKTETEGDCLYEGIYILQNGVKPADYETAVTALRTLASTGMSDQMVTTSILLIRSGSAAGLGSRMSVQSEQAQLQTMHNKLKQAHKGAYSKFEEKINPLFKDLTKHANGKGSTDQAGILLDAIKDQIDQAVTELEPEEDEDENPRSVPKKLFRWVSTADAGNALKNGITFTPEGGGIPTSTKGSKGIAITSGAVAMSVCLVIDPTEITGFKFEYVPTRSKLKEVKIKCDVPAKAIRKAT
jgi:hypothetical protein